jgi:ubiquinone/menaquinone biosynthesis C-methylase UbiE/predicted transcriptional regulator
MAAESGSAAPTPERIFETLTAYQRTEPLRAAIELDLFTAIAEGANTVSVLAKRCNASERGIRMLSDNLAAAGFITKRGREYSLTEESAKFLDRRSSHCVAAAARFLTLPKLMDAYRNLAEVVRTGNNGLGGAGSVEPENPIWVDFARSMGPLQAPFAQAIAQTLNADAGRKWKVLDIAAGHGTFGIVLAKRNPNAEIFALDWPAVLRVAQENARAAGVGNRYHTIAGNAFEVDLGFGYDVILLTGFLHHFDPITIEKLLRRVSAALAPDGRVVTLEFVPNDDRVTPPAAAAWAINMLLTTPAGDAYTFAEYGEMFRKAGFSSNELIRVPGAEALIVSRK